jgi:hypothetical protein
MTFQFACRKPPSGKDLEPAGPSQFYSLMNGALCLFYTLYAVRYTSFCRLLFFVYRLYSTIVENPLQIDLFMQNKPNLKYAQMNISPFLTIDYVIMDTWLSGKNKPNQSQTNPIQTQMPNFPK